MPTQILITREPCGVLVAVRGIPDASAIHRAAEPLTAISSDADDVIVDLRDAVLVPPGPVIALVAALRKGTPGRPMALVCDRLSGRRLLRAGCRHLQVAVLDAHPATLAADFADGGSPVRRVRALPLLESPTWR